MPDTADRRETLVRRAAIVLVSLLAAIGLVAALTNLPADWLPTSETRATDPGQDSGTVAEADAEEKAERRAERRERRAEKRAEAEARQLAAKQAKQEARQKAKKKARKKAKKQAKAAAASAAANPLAGHRMGVYQGPGDQAWAPYERSTGVNRELLAKIALRPKAKWFGAWIPDREIRGNVAAYIANSTGGDPDVLVQMTVFRMVPWEHAACGRLPTPAEQASYKYWIDEFAAGVGSAHAAIVLQPDGPFALCAPGGSRLPSELIKYAATKFAALPNTSVYIDGGAADWPKDNPAEAAEILVRAGVDRVRGFALNSTHYVALPDDIAFGTKVVAELARRGIGGKHFVINTSSNGRGFEFNLGRGSHPDNANVCQTPQERVCVTLGIPPTVDVANPRWGLSPELAAAAAEHVDAYLWFGRPWLHMQNDPFVLDRALAMARTTPW
ncbi:glycoside hydrolase family 6 protein [Nocardioides campestrisoli]|uniref:glycoside hydrolase family 6 protein n=1 Tax=Nocardioides campestrisoli TaxID=2736757 RepID=UPI0015E7DBA4|nr:glycoside hydrolase family 6 protein [Nocardioides campestrisoli]